MNAAAHPPPAGQWGVVASLGSTQTLGWASSYYLPAFLAAPLAAELDLPLTRVFAAFTLALLVSALVGPAAGRAIDRHGGRAVLRVTNLIFATGLAALGLAQAEWQVWAVWAVIGLAMGSGLYDAAFATLVRFYPLSARNAITGITLIAGFASTVGWPLTSAGWRPTAGAAPASAGPACTCCWVCRWRGRSGRWGVTAECAGSIPRREFSGRSGKIRRPHTSVCSG